MADIIRLLHVDDDPDFADMAGEFLEREDRRFDIQAVRTAEEALEYLETNDVDCVISDYEMPGTNGIEFLETLRVDHPDLPFILFTGKGSEDIASEAISAGVSDYLQKQGGTDQYTVLANRITNAVEGYIAEQQRRQWKRAVETAAEGIAILDEDGRYLQMNGAYAGAYGLTPEDLIGTRSRELYPDDVADWFEQEVRPTLHKEGSWEGMAVATRADGTRFEQDLSLAVLDDGGHVCVMQDVSGETVRNRDLQRYETVVEALGDPIYAMDPEGRYTYVNDAFVEETGYARDEIIGAQAGKVVSPEDLERTRDLIKELLRDDDRRSGRIRVVRIDADGKRKPYESRLALIQSDDGEFHGVAGTTRDMTEWVETREELERQNERLEQFANLVSHDLRNPLTVAAGRLELARETCESPHLAAVDSALERMDALIDDMLTLAKEGDDVTVEVVELATIVEDCWATVETADATLQNDVESTILADPGRLKQVLENLIRNAVEHGGSDVSVVIGDMADGFYVEDDGPGVPETDRDTVFDAGYSLTSDGTGFGLSIAKEIAEAHGWDIRVREGTQGGARFEISGVAFDE